jgi:hypothetical protein
MAAYCTSVYYPRHQTSFPTSEQWLLYGLSDWTIGLKSAVAHLASNLHQQVRQQYRAIQRQSLTQEERNDQVERILGSVPDGQSMAGLASGFARLSGLDTPIARLEDKIPHLFDSFRNLEYCKLQCIRIWQFYVPFSFRLRIL